MVVFFFKSPRCLDFVYTNAQICELEHEIQEILDGYKKFAIKEAESKGKSEELKNKLGIIDATYQEEIERISKDVSKVLETQKETKNDYETINVTLLNKIKLVDDEILSRRAISYALEKASLASVNLEDPAVALSMATDTPYDLIFLDVQMPGMDGFELCTRIRALPLNKTTPIIFVTSLTDFKSRAKSSLSGGNDLIAKPFMFIELTVKALTHILRHQVVPRRQAA